MGRKSGLSSKRVIVEPLDRRLLFAAGSVDITYGVAGIASHDLRQGNDQVNAVAVRSLDNSPSSGALLLAGSSVDPQTHHSTAFLAQLRSAGARPGIADSSFAGGAGQVFDTSGSNTDWSATDVTVLPNGQIALAGQYVSPGDNGKADPNNPLDVAPFLKIYSASGQALTNSPGAVEGPGFGAIVGVAQTSDGKLLYLTSHVTSSGVRDFFIRKANPDTTPFTDPSGRGPFSTDGFVETNFGGGDDTPVGFSVRGDDSVLIAGTAATSGDSSAGFTLVHYLADGSLDTAFGAGGSVITTVGQSDTAQAFVVTPDGQILIGGAMLTASGSIPVVLRYNPTGAIDSTFGYNGVLILPDLSGNQGVVASLVVQPNRQILAAIKDAGTAAVLRINPDGNLDTSFGTSGTVHVPFADVGTRVSIALSADQKSAFVGGTLLNSNKLNPTNDLAAVRLSTVVPTTSAPTGVIGGLDPNFGQNGIAQSVLTLAAITTVDTQALPDGHILSAGYTAAGDFSITRFNSDGSLDGSFGDFGFSKASFRNLPGVLTSVATSMTVQSNGDIVIAGYSMLADGSAQISLARFTAGGALDNTFGQNGASNNGTTLIDLSQTLGTSGTFDVANDIVQVSSDGSFYLAGAIGLGDDEDAVILHILPAGFLDTAYGNAGLVNVGISSVPDFASAIALQNNAVVFAGAETDSSGDTHFFAGRVVSATLDSSFGDSGHVIVPSMGNDDVATTIVVTSAGKLVLGGTSLLSAGSDETSSSSVADISLAGAAARIALVGLTSGGQLDPAFGTAGISTVMLPGVPLASVNSLMIDTSGRLLVSADTAAGARDVDNNNFGAAVLRFNANGSLDTTFGATDQNGRHVGYVLLFQPTPSAPAVPGSDDTLSSDFQKLFNSSQGILSMVNGGDILALATMNNNGSNTTYQTAAILTNVSVNRTQLGNGGTPNDPHNPDLVATLSVSVPAGSLLGAKIQVVLVIQNLGDVVAHGEFPVVLFLSSDGQVNSANTVIYSGSMTAKTVRYNGKQTFSFPVTLPKTIAANSYFVVSKIAPAPRQQVSKFSYSFTSKQINIAPPFVDVHGTFVAVPKSLAAKKKNAYSVVLQNSGNVQVRGPIAIKLFASLDPNFDPTSDISLATDNEVVHLQANQTHRYNFFFTPNSVPTSAVYLAAIIDYTGTPLEQNPVDNVLITTNPLNG